MNTKESSQKQLKNTNRKVSTSEYNYSKVEGTPFTIQTKKNEKEAKVTIGQMIVGIYEDRVKARVAIREKDWELILATTAAYIHAINKENEKNKH